MKTAADIPAELLAALQAGPGQPAALRVTLAYAQSLDGAIAAQRGQPLALSCQESLVWTHQLRAAHAAILVGIGTVLADDPRLTVRLSEGCDPQPVVLDSQLRMPLEAQLLKNQRQPWIITSRTASASRAAALEARGARLFYVDRQRSAPADVIAILRAVGINSLMVEGGAAVLTSFLQSQLVDLLVITLAPRLVGGLRALDMLLPTFPRLEPFGFAPCGADLWLWGRPDWRIA